MSLIDRQYLSTLNHNDIRKIVIFIRVRDIDAREHDSFEYMKLNFYMNDILIKRNTFNFDNDDIVIVISAGLLIYWYILINVIKRSRYVSSWRQYLT